MWGIIGGSGLYALEGLEIEFEERGDTPFGPPSSPIRVGSLAGTKVAFLARHGDGHVLLPSEVNYRANIYALKRLGVRAVLSVSAVGSLRAGLEPGDFCLPSQFIDWTKGKRAATFFGGGLVGHLAAAEPTSAELARHLAQVIGSDTIDARVHRDLTYVCVEGPRLSTRAESFMFRSMSADIIGMTAVPEVFLAAEANLHYQTLGVITDYDCWQPDPSLHVAPDQIIAYYMSRIDVVRQVVRECVTTLNPTSLSRGAYARAGVLTARDRLSAEHTEVLNVLES
jgi:5'-methylthioadenosine phosphorylase